MTGMQPEEEADQAGGASRPTGVGDPARDAARFIEGRIRSYGDLWLHAADRLAQGKYESSDLITDWFSLWGRGLGDLRAATMLWWKSAAAAAIPPDKPVAEYGTLYNDYPIDFSAEFAVTPRSLEFACSDLENVETAAVIAAADVKIEPYIETGVGTGFVRVIVQALGLDAGLVRGHLYEKKEPTKPIATISLTVPPAYSRY